MCWISNCNLSYPRCSLHTTHCWLQRKGDSHPFLPSPALWTDPALTAKPTCGLYNTMLFPFMHTVFLPCLSRKLPSFSFWVSHFRESVLSIRWSLTLRLPKAASSNPLLRFAESMGSILLLLHQNNEGLLALSCLHCWCFHPLGRWKGKVLMIQCPFCSCNVLPEGGNLLLYRRRYHVTLTAKSVTGTCTLKCSVIWGEFIWAVVAGLFAVNSEKIR